MHIKMSAWIAGIFSASYFPQLPPFILCCLISLVFILIYLIKRSYFVLLLTFFSMGLTWSILFSKTYLSWELPKYLENKSILVKGYITSIPERENQKIKFQFNITEINGKPSYSKIKLSWHRPSSISNSKIRVGTKWQLNVKLKRPHSLMNPGGFDLEKFYFQEKIRAVGYVVNNKSNFQVKGFNLTQIPNQFRQFLYEKMTLLAKEDNLMGVIIALCLGIRNYITSEQWSLFQATGTSHLIAISGLHIGLVASFFHLLTIFIWRRSYYLMNQFPTQQAQAIGALLGGFIYSLLAGFSIPTKRALIMISVFCVSSLCRRHISPWRSFAIAALIVLGVEPLCILSESFWLSFGAVFFIFYVISYRISFGKSLWSQYGKIQYAVTIGLVPLTFLFFQQTSIVSFPANFIAIPWVSYLVIPVALLGMFLLFISEQAASCFLLLSSKLLQIVFIFLKHLGNHEYSRIYQGISSIWVAILLIMGVFLMLSPKGIPGRWIGAFVFLPLFFPNKKLLPEKNVGFTLLDVGQGLSAVIQTRFHTLVFDTGVKFSGRFDMGKAVVLPYFRAQNIQKIDVLMISHRDNDHMGGAHSILKEFKVKKVITSVPSYFPREITEICYRGQRWVWDGVEFEVLYPKLGSAYVGNNSSCTLQIKTGPYRILITGDLEKKGENELLKMSRGSLASIILIAGHHGSKTSSTWEFVQEVKPVYVLFSSGYLNQYRFPHPQVVARFKRQGSLVENTAVSGGIYFEVDYQLGITKTIRYRKKLKKYWHHP